MAIGLLTAAVLLAWFISLVGLAALTDATLTDAALAKAGGAHDDLIRPGLLLAPIGWMAGLLVSGFPSILAVGRRDAPAAPGAPATAAGST